MYASNTNGAAMAQQKMAADVAYAQKPIDDRPLLPELQDRLAGLTAHLRAGNDRVEAFTNRVFGAAPTETDAGHGPGGTPPSAVALLTVLLSHLEREVCRLHNNADRVERIG